MKCKLALGTAQFGLVYGISNTRGQVPADEVKLLLQMAADAGIDTLDTANAYGESEAVLGKALDESSTFRIITKYPAHDSGRSPSELWQESYVRLGGRQIYGYLLHNYAEFRHRLHLVDFLQKLRAEGCVQRTGFSLYHPDELQEIFDRGLPFELVQVPCSVLDQRFIPFFPELQRRGVEVHIRSAFLQGLVFRSPDSLGDFFRPARDILLELRRIAERMRMSIVELCLGFCLMQKGVDRVIVGVDGMANLLQNIAACKMTDRLSEHLDELIQLQLTAPQILNPSLWQKT